MFISPKEILEEVGLKDQAVVADFGCGAGICTFLTSKLVGDEGKVYAVDTNREILDKISREADKMHTANIDTLLSDVEHKVLINNQSCDLVIMSNILSEIANLGKVIGEAKRILLSRGQILIIDWKADINDLTKKRANLLSEEKLVALLAKEGLEVKKHLGAGNYHYAFLVSFVNN